MVLLLTPAKAQKLLPDYIRQRRLAAGLTQEGLALRSGVKLATLRKFEQTGVLSLTSFLKLLMVVDALEGVVAAVAPPKETFASIDDVVASAHKPGRKRGWLK